jgi:hypothetical protein
MTLRKVNLDLDLGFVDDEVKFELDPAFPDVDG